MPVSDNIETFADVERAFRSALLNPSGALQVIPGASPDEIRRRAVRWRQRAYRFRELLRKQAHEAYAGTSRDAEKDKTQYDTLVIRLHPQGCVILEDGIKTLPAPVGLDGINPPELTVADKPGNDILPLDFNGAEELKPDLALALELLRKEGLS